MSATSCPRITIAAFLVLGTFSLAACQEVEQPSPSLTPQQWEQVQKNIIDPDEDGEPTPEYTTEIKFDDKIELVGFSINDPNTKEDNTIVAGEKVKFRWYWRTLEEMSQNWKIFIHFDSNDTSVAPAKRRQNLDHEPMNGMYPTSKWSKGKIIEDVQEVRIRPDYPASKAVPYIGFYRGKTRLPIEEDAPKTDDRRYKGPSLTVVNNNQTASSGDSGTPTYTVEKVDAETAEAISVDGKLEEDVWEEIDALELSSMRSGANFATEVDVFRTDEHLYLGARLEDTHIWSKKAERDANLWEEEVLEMFVDPNGDAKNYLELQINPKGTVFDANFETRKGTGDGSDREQIDRAKKFDLEGLESAVDVDGTLNDESDEDKQWTVELKVPLESIPEVDGDTSFDEPWAVNLYRFDRPADGEKAAYGWSTDLQGEDFHNVDQFGRFEFAGTESEGESGDSKESGDSTEVDKEQALERLKEEGSDDLPAKKIREMNPKLKKELRKMEDE